MVSVPLILLEWVGGLTIPGTYAACCRKRGVHTSKSRDGRSEPHHWNEDVIASMASSMVPRWRAFCNAFQELGLGASNDIGSFFEEITGMLGV
jgi:hypothetical protein